jgi:aryl-alcohol dehydrogenase
VIEVAYTGICQTDIKAMQGKQGTSKPAVLGHEGVGVVVSVGAAVQRVLPGDHVLMNFASCGLCISCQGGQPSYCHDVRRLNMVAERADHSSAYVDSHVHSHFFGQSSFATHSITSERNVVKLPPDFPLEIAGAMGCGVLTGSGAVLNALKVRPGSSVVVTGAGAVGLSAVMAARIAGASIIIAVDPVALRQELAMVVGATHAFDAKAEDVVEKTHALTNGGADYSVEASGSPAALELALASLGVGGACGVAGAAGDVDGAFRWRNLILRGLTIRGVANGDVNPPIFVPKLIQYYREGRFPVDRISRVYPFAQINEALADAQSGKTVKPVLKVGHD